MSQTQSEKVAPEIPDDLRLIVDDFLFFREMAELIADGRFKGKWHPKVRRVMIGTHRRLKAADDGLKNHPQRHLIIKEKTNEQIPAADTAEPEAAEA